MMASNLSVNMRLITYHLGTRTDPACVTLPPGKLMRLPGTVRAVRVLAGRAWITHRGQDIMLATGDEYVLVPDSDAALVSAVGDGKLVLEIWS